MVLCVRIIPAGPLKSIDPDNSYYQDFSFNAYSMSPAGIMGECAHRCAYNSLH